MAYIGLDPNTPLLNTSTQLFSGNGAVTQFTLNRAVASSSDLDVIVGNVAQVPGVDYVAGNTTIIFTVAPGAGSDNVAVTYRGGALNSLDLSASVFQAGAVGAPSVYSLASNNAGIYWASANTMGIVVTGANRALFNANATSVNSVTGAIVTPGGIGVGGNIHIGNQATINGGVESTSVSTGTLRVTGGAGITGNLNIGGDITCVGDFTVNGTFTTTGTDSLEVNDPFIFLANANPGDTYDSGVISEYFDGTNTRYTGYFRDITDNTFKFFGNLLPKPGTTVDTANTSYSAANVTVGNLSATGNVTASYFVGNGAALTGISTDTTQIQNGNSRISIPSINGNIVNNVNGVTIANVWSGGISVVGAVAASTTISATGNVTGGNVDTAGLITATGNITSAANVSGGNILTGGLISATGNITGGNISAPVGKIDASAYGTVISTGNVVGANVNTSGLISATGNVTGGNILTAGNVSATGNVLGNFILGNVAFATGANLSHNHPGIINGTSNIRIGVSNGNANVNIGGISNVAVFADTGLFVNGLTSVTGSITGGNLITGALAQAVTLSVTGGVTFSTATEEIGIGNSMTSGVIGIGGPSQTGVIAFGQSTASQTVNVATGATASASTKTVNLGTNGAANSQTNINIGTNLGNATVQYTANTIVAIANTSGSALSVAGNVTGGNLRTAGQVSATANVSGGNVISAGLVNAGTTVSAAGNVTGGNIITGGAVSAVGVISATANVTGGNIITGGAVSATGNVSATANVLGGNVISSALVQGVTVSASGNVIGGNLNAAGLSLSGNVISALSMTTNITTTANVTGGNILTGGLISATGNITAGAYYGNGGPLTGLDATNISTGTLAQARLANSSLTVNGTSIALGGSGTVTATATNALTIGTGLGGTSYNGSTGVTITNTGVLSLANGGGITASASTGAITLGSTATSVNTASAIVQRDASGNFSAGTITATLSGAATTAGTVTTAAQPNITSVGTLSSLAVTGNISGGNVLGGANVNATLFTGTTVSVTGNVTGGNINSGGQVVATGNITGGNISTAGNMAAPTLAQNTNSTAVATTAFVLGQLSSSTPAAIASAGAVGTGTTFARADHTHSGVTSITGTSNQVTASASAGAVTLSLPQSIATSSAVQFGSITVTTGNITLGNVINGGANLSGNIGSATGYFNTVFAKATSAQYADLAETYRADAEYPPGTVLSFGGDFEVTLTTGQNCARVAGIVSTNPAHVMNAGLESEHTAVLALTGRVPASVVGTVRKGDMMISAGNGQAMSCATPAMGTVIGKALQDHSGESGIIEIVVGRM